MKQALAALLGATGTIFAAIPAQAAYVVELREIGGNVVATGSGTINLAALDGPFEMFNLTPEINPSFPLIGLGPPPTGIGVVDLYNGGAGPISWGPGGDTDADAGSGNYVGASYDLAVGIIAVPTGYVSGAPLGTSTAVFTGQSFASLGLSPGTYVSNWGSGASADSFTVNVAIPEPATWAMLLIGFGAMGLCLRGRRRVSGPQRAHLTAAG